MLCFPLCVDVYCLVLYCVACCRVVFVLQCIMFDSVVCCCVVICVVAL